jgi:hypothetical protein
MRTKLLVLTCGIVILFNVNQSSAEHLSPPLWKLCEAADGEAFGSSSSDAPGTDPETQKVQPSPARSAEDIEVVPGKVVERRKVTVEVDGKARTVVKESTTRVDEDFAWKDPKAAEKAGMSLTRIRQMTH